MNLEPHIQSGVSARSLSLDMLIPMLFLLPMAIFYNGMRAVMLILASVATTVIVEFVWCKLRKAKASIGDLSAVVTGLTIAMLLPVGVPYFVPVVGGIFAIMAAKMPFGGLGRSPFNPVAAALAFVTICWPARVFGYINPSSILPVPLFGEAQEHTVSSAAQILKNGGEPAFDRMDMLLGNVPGAMGTTSIIVIIACAAYLLYRKSAIWQIPVAFIGTSAVIAAMFPRVMTGTMSSVAFELLSGSLIFAAVFLASDLSTAPKLPAARFIYGCLGAIFLMMFRHLGTFEEGSCFAILLINAVAPSLDRLIFNLRNYMDDRFGGAELEQ